jgi:drug/metabolite transporter (DMT)-like permease
VPVSTLRYTLVALAFSALWASGFPVTKLILREAPPFTVMAARFLAAGGALLLWALAAGVPVPRSPHDWWRLGLLRVLNQTLYIGVTGWVLLWLSAGTAAVLASTNPLLLALVALWFLAEPLTLRKALGLGLAYLGVLWVMGRRVGPDDPAWAMAAWVGLMAFLVAGTILFKRWRLEHHLAVLTGGPMAVGGAVLVGPALALESPGAVSVSPRLAGLLLYVIVATSLGAMLLWFWLLRHGDAMRASAWFFLNPVLGLAASALVLGEPLHGQDFLGALVVGAGIALVQRG